MADVHQVTEEDRAAWAQLEQQRTDAALAAKATQDLADAARDQVRASRCRTRAARLRSVGGFPGPARSFRSVLHLARAAAAHAWRRFVARWSRQCRCSTTARLRWTRPRAPRLRPTCRLARSRSRSSTMRSARRAVRSPPAATAAPKAMATPHPWVSPHRRIPASSPCVLTCSVPVRVDRSRACAAYGKRSPPVTSLEPTGCIHRLLTAEQLRRHRLAWRHRRICAR